MPRLARAPGRIQARRNHLSSSCCRRPRLRQRGRVARARRRVPRPLRGGGRGALLPHRGAAGPG
eukprot:5958377-Pyramimonas_sp.AAC.1